MSKTITSKPVATIGTLLTAAEAGAAYLVANHVIPAAAAPWTALGLAAAALTAIHELVAPYRKVRDALERDGLLSDADVERLEAIVAQHLGIELGDDETVQHPTSPA